MKKIYFMLIALLFLSCTNNEDDCDCRRATTFSGWMIETVSPEDETNLSQAQKESISRQCIEKGCE